MAVFSSFPLRRPRFLIKDYDRAVFVCFVTFLSTAYTAVYPFTYLPHMIVWFGYKEEDKGFYAGFVASAYFSGSVLFSYFWGWLSDRIGRKPILTFMLMCTGIFCFLYGFCTNLYIAITIRFLDGVVNGLDAVVNAILYDHSNNDNQAFAASIVACARGLGMCLGPLIAGYLAEPAIKYPERFARDGLFGRFPYLIPSLIGFGLSVVAAVSVFLALPSPGSGAEKDALWNDGYIKVDETQEPTDNEKHTKDRTNTEHSETRNCSNNNNLPNLFDAVPNSNTRGPVKAKLNDEKTPLTKYGADKRHLLFLYIDYFVWKMKSNNIFSICNQPGVKLVLIINMMYNFTAIGHWELLPVWLSTTRTLGGLGFASDQIGLFLGTVSMIGLGLQALLVVQLEKRLGAILSYMIFTFMLTVSIQLTTLSRLADSVAEMWTIIYLNNTILSTALPATLAMVTVLTNNCAPIEHVGALNGIALTLGGVARAVAPVVGGNIYSASITSSIGAPIDSSTAFVFFGVNIWLTTIAMYFLPRNLNFQHRNKKVTIVDDLDTKVSPMSSENPENLRRDNLSRNPD